MFDLTKYCHEFHTNKLTVINKIIPNTICYKMVDRAKQIVSAGKTTHIESQGNRNHALLDGGGYYHYEVMGMEGIQDYFPELIPFYHSLVPLISIITHHHVIPSPHVGSEITLKIYQAAGATQGWHYDTNAITALLYLTSNQEGATRCKVKKYHPNRKLSKTETRKIYPKAGSLLLMKGREVWHCAEPINKEFKVVVPLNYYLKNDTWRPEGIDELIYGKTLPKTQLAISNL